MTILIIVAVVLLVLLFGGLLAWFFTRADHVVTQTKTEIVEEERAYNPAVTLGHEIKVNASYEEQLREARREAAERAAALPRGGNFGIGYLGNERVATASQGLANDPLTAVRIAQFHGWDGARSGIPAGGVPVAAAAAPAAVAAAPAQAEEIELVPGRDYPVIEITDDMSPEDVRKARTANAKARSAAMKAAKAAQQGAVAAPAAAAPAVAASAAAAAPVAVGVEPPKLIEITDDMSPEDVRKARIANAKAQSAYNKALKAAGVSPDAVVEAGVPAEAAPVVTATPAPAAPIGIEPPTLIEITDDMPPEEVRKARVANAKAQSAYNKALKAAGIDPATVAAGGAVAAAGAATPAPAEAPPVAATRAAVAVEEQPSQAEIEKHLDEHLKAFVPEEMAKFKVAIESIEGVGAAMAEKLRAAGIETPLDLLRMGATPQGRKAIAERSGLAESLILTWVNHADLFRIRGVGEEYADLLEKSGVDTVVELSHRNPANLTEKLTEVNSDQQLVQKLPSQSQVEDWIGQAKELPRAVFYSGGGAKVEAPAPQAAAAKAVEAPAPAGGPTPESLGIPRPDLVVITDDMSPDDVRRARIDNAKAMSAFNKAVKAAGVDPSTVQL